MALAGVSGRRSIAAEQAKRPDRRASQLRRPTAGTLVCQVLRTDGGLTSTSRARAMTISSSRRLREAQQAARTCRLGAGSPRPACLEGSLHRPHRLGYRRASTSTWHLIKPNLGTYTAPNRRDLLWRARPQAFASAPSALHI